MDDLGLLLAHADDGRPVLPDEMDLAAAAGAPRPREHDLKGDLRDDAKDPNDLHAQGWGLVVPDDDRLANRLVALIDPLVQERRRQTGRAPKVYKVPKGMGPEDASTWWSDVYQHEGDRDHDRPRYLLILGDADVISWDFQQRLALDIFIGRLAFPAEDDYAAYANKVLACERARPKDAARALFHTVRDGTAATNVGHVSLMQPTVRNARQSKERGLFHAKEIVWLDETTRDIDLEDLMKATAAAEPTMLFSVSHGAGAPRGGWKSVEQMRRFQGQMCLLEGEKLTHEHVAKGPFLPGGAWFYFACLGAGTPGESAYRVWLDELKGGGLFKGPIEDVVASLPKPGEPPFVARLPQAALANPDGPLSVIGHVDLAWSHGFQEYRVENGKTVTRDRPSRFEGIFSSIVEGRRMGAAYTALQRQCNSLNATLAVHYRQEAQARSRGASEPADPAKEHARKMNKASLWMASQDLSAYVLLGDPAARLNVRSAHAHAEVTAPIPSLVSVVSGDAPAAAPAPAAKPSGVKKLDSVEKMERAILSVLTDEKKPRDVAEKLGLEADDVKAWVLAYQEAGRKALKDL